MFHSRLQVIRWSISAPRAELVKQLKSQMQPCVSQAFLTQLFHSNFNHHIAALNTLTEVRVCMCLYILIITFSMYGLKLIIVHMFTYWIAVHDMHMKCVYVHAHTHTTWQLLTALWLSCLRVWVKCCEVYTFTNSNQHVKRIWNNALPVL